MSNWTKDRRALLLDKVIGAKGTSADVDLMIEVAERTGLDPFAGQIYAKWSRQKDNNNWIDVFSVETTIEGLREIADRTGQYVGQLGPQWCGIDGKWVDVWTDTQSYPYAARVGILRSTFREPCWGLAYWSESVQTTKDGTVNSMWQQRSMSQLAKCAEAAGLRRSFPAIARLYCAEEMPPADNEEEQHPEAPVAPQRVNGAQQVEPEPLCVEADTVAAMLAELQTYHEASAWSEVAHMWETTKRSATALLTEAKQLGDADAVRDLKAASKAANAHVTALREAHEAAAKVNGEAVPE